MGGMGGGGMGGGGVGVAHTSGGGGLMLGGSQGPGFGAAAAAPHVGRRPARLAPIAQEVRSEQATKLPQLDVPEPRGLSGGLPDLASPSKRSGGLRPVGVR